jgi:hypothetical protein
MTDVLDPASAPTEEPDAGAPAETESGLPLLDGDTVFTLHLRWFVALCSVAAGVWHVLYAFSHLDHHVVLGQSFIATGIVQIAWAAWLLRGPSRRLIAAGATLAFLSIVVWVFAHSTGISWYPGLEVAEIIGWGDTVTKLFELGLLLGSIVLLLPKSVHREATSGRSNATVVALMFVAIAAILTINYVGAYDPGHPPEGEHTHGPAEADTAHDH